MSEFKPPSLKEGILKDPELGEGYWNGMVADAGKNPVFRKLIREGLYSDVAGALGHVQDVVWLAAQPLCIGRGMLKVIPTKNALERFPKEFRGYAIQGEAPPLGTGGMAEFQNVLCNIEFSLKKEWSQSYAEDASWDVLKWEMENLGRAMARLETEKVVATFAAVASGDLAGSVDCAGVATTWANVVDLSTLVEKEDFHPNVIALHSYQYSDLVKLDQFIHSLYRGPDVMLGKGIESVQHSTLGITFLRSSTLPFTAAGANATIGYAIDLDAAGVILMRRDLTIKPYEDPSRNMYGVMATERMGCGILRTKSIARIRNTKP